MDRRELLQSIAGVVGVAGLPATVAAVEEPIKRPALIVIESDQMICRETADRLAAMWPRAVKGTPFEGVKCVVLGDGMRVTFVAEDGTLIGTRRARTDESQGE